MINNPLKHVKDYVEAGSDIITVHAEVTDESSFGEIHDYLKQNQIGVGMAINPDTEIPQWFYKFIPTLDQLIVMSVVPGKSGQKYIQETHAKIQRITQVLDEHKFEGYIEADGGINLDNVESCFLDGARIFVGGGAIVGTPDVRGVIREFRDKISHAKRRLLLQNANRLGGKELVEKWIALHIVNPKNQELTKLAKEMGYI
jgi:transketolase